jgi:hypothetical protein
MEEAGADMVIDNVFRLNSPSQTGRIAAASPSIFSRLAAGISRMFARTSCGLHGHLMLMHFEPNKLSLQCGLCGYESEGWEVGRPMTSRRQIDNRQARPGPERRRTMRPLPSTARMAS